jgi:DNA-binding CsgD family transcriptional regulator
MHLIERSDFLDTMQRQFREVISGNGHCIFVVGEAGIGKTSLVRAFLKQIEGDSIIYMGTCDPLFTPRPLAPMYDVALQMEEGWTEKIHSKSSRADLFISFFQALTQKALPVVLFFEDVHWADEATQDFIKFFSRRISSTKCLFVLTYRDNEIHQQHPLLCLPGDLVAGTFTHLSLNTLSKQAVAKMADERGYDGEDVYAISGGNPFYVTEILAHYSPGVPDNIKNAVLSVYVRQPENTKQAWQLLSVIPEGLELERLFILDPSFPAAIEDSLEKKILIIQKNRIFFKHELYRRTIEASISPFRRIALNKQILHLFLEHFREDADIERIVQYAKNANEGILVVQYAPLAAKKAADVGAHTEAAKLYLTAIEYTDRKDQIQLVALYESYAYECYLTSQIKNAIIYTRKALEIWQDKNDVEQIGNSLRFLSRLWWFEGKRQEAENYAIQAVNILEGQPTSKAKAMAYSNMSHLKMLSKDIAECVEWGNKAIELARALNDEEILAHALNNLGTAQMKNTSSKDAAVNLLEESLAISLKNSFHEHVARAYTNLISTSIAIKEWEIATQYLQEGLSYCEERDLDAWTKYKLAWKAKMLLDTGDWEQAERIAANLLNKKNQMAIVEAVSLVVLASIKTRRGDAEAHVLLMKVKELAISTQEHQRILPAFIACMEWEWLHGIFLISDLELQVATVLVQKIDNAVLNSEFSYWMQQTRGQRVHLQEEYKPYKLLKNGKVRTAAQFWEAKKCLFDQALTLFEGNEEDKKKALGLMQQLGAEAFCEKMKMDMRASGIKKIPRGIRESTKNNPAQLTKRELDVLKQLRQGKQNKEIADTLFISAKTVDHHISAILSKLHARTRSKAVAEASRLGIIE